MFRSGKRLSACRTGRWPAVQLLGPVVKVTSRAYPVVVAEVVVVVTAAGFPFGTPEEP